MARSDADNTTFGCYVDTFDSRRTGLPRGEYFVTVTATGVQLSRRLTRPSVPMAPVPLGGAA